MSKDPRDPGTIDLFGLRPVGRPKSRHALTGAQRQARYRESSKARIDALASRFAKLSDVTIARYMSDPEQDPEERRSFWLELGRRYGFK